MATKTKTLNPYFKKLREERQNDLSTASARKAQTKAKRLSATKAKEEQAKKRVVKNALSADTARKEQRKVNAASAKQRAMTKNDLSTAAISRERKKMKWDQYKGMLR